MNREQQFIADLHHAMGNNEKEIALAETEENQARLPIRTAVRLWANGAADMSDAAFGLLLGVGDLAIVPVLEGPLRNDPLVAAQAIRLVTDRETELRKRVVIQLEKWLNDKRPIPERPLAPGTEGTRAEHRVCDEAYVAMRKVIHFSDDEVHQLVDADRLFNLPESMRDRAIARARATRSWRIIIDPDSVDDEPPPSSKPRRPKAEFGQ